MPKTPGDEGRGEGPEVERIRLVVDGEDAGERLDRYLADRIETLSRSRIQRLIAEGAVRSDGDAADRASRTVQEGEAIEVLLVRRPAHRQLEPEPIPLEVLYEDRELAVLSKPAGLVVHPAPGHPTGTLVQALLHRFGDRLSSVADAARPGIVHRLDKGTTGVMVVALTDGAHQALASQFAARTVAKDYLALVYGHPPDRGVVDVPLGRDRSDRKKISASTNAPRDAVTEYDVVETFPSLALVHARPRTGRTHQIRAHLAWLRHPLVGDDLYAGKQYKGITEGRIRDRLAAFPRPALHAWRLSFDHPATGERLSFEAPVPEDIRELLELLRQWRDGRL